MSDFPLRDRFAHAPAAVGYWFSAAAPVLIERVTGSGAYDFVVLDEQHGRFGGEATLNALIAVTAGGGDALVRVPALDATAIGRALDFGAGGVIVPLVESADDARRAVAASSYPPRGIRSYGPLRLERSRNPRLADIDDGVLCIVMIETAGALDQLDEICRTPGLGGLYVGPSDLRLALGGVGPIDPATDSRLEDAVESVRSTARSYGVPVGIHTPDGTTALRRVEQGFDFVSIASDPTHLAVAAAAHATTATGTRPGATTTPGRY